MSTRVRLCTDIGGRIVLEATVAWTRFGVAVSI